MKREMTVVVVAVASVAAVLARCANGGVMTVGEGVVRGSVLEMLFCRPIRNCGERKDSSTSGASASTGSRSSGTSGDKEAT
jgi:hypothetical protein